MPAFKHGRGTVVLIDGFNFSGWFREVTSSAEVEIAETTTFTADAKPAKTYIAGHSDGTFSLGGLFDGTADAIDEEIQDRLGQEADVNFTIAPSGMDIGSRVFVAQAIESSYEVSSPVSDVVGVSIEAQADGGLMGGVSLHSHTAAETVSTNSTSVDQVASTDNGGVAFLHVIAVSGGSPSLQVDLQDSADNSVWADLAPVFAAKTAIGSERIAISGTVRRYVRAQSTITGTTPSFTYAVSWSRT